MSGTIFHIINDAPTAIGPFCHATEVDGWVFLTGQIPTDPNDDKAAIPYSVEAQTRRVMDNLIIVLEGMELNLRDVVSARIYLTNFERDLYPMNAVYKSYFEAGKFPARTCVGVTGLALNALVEIDFVARRRSS